MKLELSLFRTLSLGLYVYVSSFLRCSGFRAVFVSWLYALSKGAELAVSSLWVQIVSDFVSNLCLGDYILDISWSAVFNTPQPRMKIIKDALNMIWPWIWSVLALSLL